MRKNNSDYEWECPWCYNIQVLSEDDYNNLLGFTGHPGSVFKELTCIHCRRISFSPPNLTVEQWDNLKVGENFMLEPAV